jgi:hypothetical protein
VTTQRLIYGAEGQSLAFDAPEGVPEVVLGVTVHPANQGDDKTTSALTGEPELEEVQEALTGPAGQSRADPRRLPVTDHDLEAGRRYLLQSPDGGRAWVELVEVGQDYAIARHPLGRDYGTDATLVSTRITVPVANAWAADNGNLSPLFADPRWRVRWVYTVGGATYAHDTYLDLVRYTANHTVTPPDVERLVPGFLSNLPQYHREDQGSKLIDEAYEQVAIDLHQEEKADHAARSPRIIDDLVKRKVVVLWLEARLYQDANISMDAVERAAKNYQSRFDQLVRVKARVPFDRDGSGAAKPAEHVPLFRR